MVFSQGYQINVRMCIGFEVEILVKVSYIIFNFDQITFTWTLVTSIKPRMMLISLRYVITNLHVT